MSFDEYRYLVLTDLYRVRGRIDLRTFLAELLFGEGFKCMFWVRTCAFTRDHPRLRVSLHLLARWMLRRCRYRYGISISFRSDIGPGFYVGHFSGIFVGRDCRIGRNCNIQQGVTIGQLNRGPRQGFPRLGNHVHVAAGAKIFGNVTIGDNAAIGANTVVIGDVPANAVVLGMPARVVSREGSAGYINWTDYDTVLDPPPRFRRNEDASQEA